MSKTLMNMLNWGKAEPDYSQVGGYSPATVPNPYEFDLAKIAGGKGVTPVGAGTPPPTFEPSFFQRMTGFTDANGNQQVGWGGLALGAAQGLGGAYMGMKQFGLAKDTLKEQQRQYNQNYQAQRTLINSQLSDRQLARVASNPDAYQSETEYMKKWGVR